MTGRVIITYGRSLMALTAAHSLGTRGIEVIGCDDVDMTVMNFSRYVEDYFIHAPYHEKPERYLDDLEKHIRRFKPEDNRPYILMPMFRDAAILAAHRERFEELITLAIPDITSMNRVHPKDILARTCEELELCSPKTILIQDLEELEVHKDTLEFPLLIKPADAVGGAGIHKVRDYTELQKLCAESYKRYGTLPLIQEIVEGKDYCLAALCDQGEIVAHMAYRNLHQFPRDFGAGVMRETIDDSPFLDTSKKLLKALNWNGVVQIDFRWSGEEKDPAYLIEVNPRFWAGLFHSVESGIDFPWLLYQLFAEGSVKDSCDAIIGAKTKIPGLWTLSALQDIAESEIQFEKLKRAWQQTWDSSKHENWQKRFQGLTDALRDCIDGKDMIEKVKDLHKAGKAVKSEFTAKDDPFIGLGFLFIASSLLRHGELPPEIKR